MTTLQGLREAAGLTERQLASRLLVPPERVIAWERGAAQPSYIQSRMLAVELRVSVRVVRAALVETRAAVAADLAKGLAEGEAEGAF